MSIGSLDDMRFGEADCGPSAPSFLRRGSVHRNARESVQSETTRRPTVGSGTVLLSAGVAGAILVAALGVYLVVLDGPVKLSAAAMPSEPPTARVVHEPPVPLPAPANTDADESRTESPSQTSVSEPAAEADPFAPRTVRTERVEGDPSVWANVRKFSPPPAEDAVAPEVAPTVQSPVTESAAPAPPRDVAPVRHERARAQQPRRQHRGRTHTRTHRAQMRADDGAPSDVGGTQMSRAELQRDGSKNPLVSSFASVLGPK